MSVIDDLKAKRAVAFDEARGIAERAAAANRALTDAEQHQFETIQTDLDRFDERIAGLAGQEARAGASDAKFASMGLPRVKSRGDAEVEDDFRSMLLERNPRPIELRWDNPRSNYQPGVELRAMNLSSPANLYPVSFYERIVQHMVESSSVLSAGATLLVTDSGEPLRIPTSTALPTASAVSEGGTISSSDPTVTVRTLGAFKYGHLVNVSRELLEDSGVDLQGYLARAAGEAIGQATGAKYMGGTGVVEPTGVLTNATLGVTAGTAATTDFGPQGTVGYGSDLPNRLYASIAEPYTRSTSTAWLMRSATLGKIRELKAPTTGELVGNLLLGPPPNPNAAAELLGKPVYVDPHVPALAEDAKAVLFGDFSRYFVRLVNNIRFERSDDWLWDQDMVSFRALVRTDGVLVDQTGAVKYLAMGNDGA